MYYFKIGFFMLASQFVNELKLPYIRRRKKKNLIKNERKPEIYIYKSYILYDAP